MCWSFTKRTIKTNDAFTTRTDHRKNDVQESDTSIRKGVQSLPYNTFNPRGCNLQRIFERPFYTSIASDFDTAPISLFNLVPKMISKKTMNAYEFYFHFGYE